MGLCAVSRWCEGCRNKCRQSAVKLGSRPNFRTDHAGAAGRCLLLTRKDLQVIGARAFPEPQKKQRVGGGVRSQIRTGLRLQFPAIREINREFCDLGAFGRVIVDEKPLCRSGFSVNSLQKLTGKLFSVTGKFLNRTGKFASFECCFTPCALAHVVKAFPSDRTD
jgi:hypothetical protein